VAAFSFALPLLARQKSDVIIMRNGDRNTCEIKGSPPDHTVFSVDYILAHPPWIGQVDLWKRTAFHREDTNGAVYRNALDARITGGRPITIEILSPPI